MSVIVIDMFTHSALCKDINLSEPSPSADLISISELGQQKKNDAGHPDNNKKCSRSSHPSCGLVVAVAMPSHVGQWEGPVEIISCYANTLFE